MKREDRELFLIHAEDDGYKNRISNARKITKSNSNKKPYIAFSGGKDSVVMMHLVHTTLGNKIPVFHYDYGELMLPKYFKEIQDIMKSTGAEVIIGKRYKNWYKDFFGIHQITLKKRFDLAFVGIRKEESRSRSMRIKKGESLGMIKESWPVADLTTMDVWAYIVENDLQYLSFYDEYSKLQKITDLRFVTFFDREFDKLGSSNIDGVINWREKYRLN